MAARAYGCRSKRRATLGFTLIELMVGLLIGMLTILVIAQALAVSEAKRRTIAAGSDAQTNGAMALYTLQREAQMAGYGGASNPEGLGCPVKAQFANETPFTFTLAPVVIENDPDGLPDKITFLRSRTSGFSVPIALSGAHTQLDDHFAVSTSFGARAGNMMIAVPRMQSPTSGCTLFTVTDDKSLPEASLTATVIPHRPGPQGKWNQSTSIFPSSGYAREDYLLNMGTLMSRAYSVDRSNSTSSLRVEELSPVTGKAFSQNLYPQIVNLQALYGKGTVDASGSVRIESYDEDTPVTNAEWQKVVAVRIAVVARSTHYEKEEVTVVPSAKWDVGTSTPLKPPTVSCNGPSKCINIRVDTVPDWKHYRFKVFDTIVPLRNVVWNS